MKQKMWKQALKTSLSGAVRAAVCLGVGLGVLSVEVFAASPAKPDADAVAAETMRSELLRADAKTGSRSPASASQNVVARKKYPGGADEDDLQVQPSLPIPTRTYDGSLMGDEPPTE